MRRLTVRFLVSLTAISSPLCISAPAPHDFHALPYEISTAIADGPVTHKKSGQRKPRSVITPSDYFAAKIEKRDHFIVGRKVVIDQPLLSHGGDVFIFADELVLSAAIDTRPRVRLTAPFWNLPYKYWSGPIGSEDRVAMHTLLLKGSKNVHVAQAFFDLVLWHDDYDPTCRCFRFRGVPASSYDAALHQRNYGAVDLLKDVTIPVLPFGLIVDGDPYANAGTNGTDAPTSFDRSAFKSGSIRIFARSISVCDECKRQDYADPRVAIGDPYDVERKRLLMAGGLKGGRGGPGGIAWCVPYETASRFSSACDKTWGHPGGKSGQPSAGADGGNIEINFIDNPASLQKEIRAAEYFRACGEGAQCDKIPDGFASTVTALADTTGGAPSQTQIFSTPNFNELRKNSAQKGRNVVIAVSPATTPAPALFGLPGAVTLRGTTIDLAMPQIASLLAAADVDGKYDKIRHISCLAENRKLVTQITPPEPSTPGGCADIAPQIADPLVRSLLADTLEQTLLERQQHLLADLRSYLIGDAAEAQVTLDVFSASSCREGALSSLNAIESNLMRRLCEIRQYGGKRLSTSFFFGTGGVYRTVEQVAVRDLTMERLITEQRRASNYLLTVASELKKSRFKLSEQLFEQQRLEFEVALRRLANALEGAEKAIKDTWDKLGPDYAKLESAVKSSKSAVASYGAGNYVLCAIEGFSALRDGFKFISSLSDDDYGRIYDVYEAREKHRGKLEELTIELYKFMESANNYQNRINLENSALVGKYIEQEKALAASVRNVRFDFSKLARGAVRGYSLDGFAGPGVLDSNLSALSDLMLHYPDNRLDLHSAMQIAPCGAADMVAWESLGEDDVVKCVLIRSRDGFTSIVPANESDKIRQLPLIVIQPDKSGRAYPFSLFGVYTKKQLSIQ
jgi:hypothetical protein